MYSINMSFNRWTSYKINNISDNIITLENGVVLNYEMKNLNISVNVFGLNDNNDIVGHYYFSINENAMHINLLLLEVMV